MTLVRFPSSEIWSYHSDGLTNCAYGIEQASKHSSIHYPSLIAVSIIIFCIALDPFRFFFFVLPLGTRVWCQPLSVSFYIRFLWIRVKLTYVLVSAYEIARSVNLQAMDGSSLFLGLTTQPSNSYALRRRFLGTKSTRNSLLPRAPYAP